MLALQFCYEVCISTFIRYMRFFAAYIGLVAGSSSDPIKTPIPKGSSFRGDIALGPISQKPAFERGIAISPWNGPYSEGDKSRPGSEEAKSRFGTGGSSSPRWWPF